MIRRLRFTVDDYYRRHFSFVILDEGQLCAYNREEENRCRFGKNIESTLEDVLAPGLPDQLVALSPDFQFDSRRKHGIRRKFVLADTSIVKFRVQLDGGTRFGWFGRFGRLIGDFRKATLTAEEMRGQTGHLAPGIPGKGHGYAAQPFEKTGFRFRQQFSSDLC